MEPSEYPIDGVLDLHVFNPADVDDLLPEYLRACLRHEILQVRVIHGKGTGVLRQRVHAILDRLPIVARYQLASDRSSWGATLVQLKPEEGEEPDDSHNGDSDGDKPGDGA